MDNYPLQDGTRPSWMTGKEWRRVRSAMRRTDLCFEDVVGRDEAHARSTAHTLGSEART